MFWWSISLNGFGKGPERNLAVELALGMDCQGLARELVDGSEDTERLAVVRAILDEVIGPDAIAACDASDVAGCRIRRSPSTVVASAASIVSSALHAANSASPVSGLHANHPVRAAGGCANSHSGPTETPGERSPNRLLASCGLSLAQGPTRSDGVLALQFLNLVGLTHLHAAELMVPSVVTLFRDVKAAAILSNGLAPAQADLRFAQHADDLFGFASPSAHIVLL